MYIIPFFILDTNDEKITKELKYFYHVLKHPEMTTYRPKADAFNCSITWGICLSNELWNQYH